MKAIVGRTNLGEKLKGCIHLVFGTLYGRVAGCPWKKLSPGSERVFPGPAEGVPVGDGKAHMLFHGFSGHDPGFIIEFKGQGIVRFPAFEYNLPDAREILFVT